MQSNRFGRKLKTIGVLLSLMLFLPLVIILIMSGFLLGLFISGAFVAIAGMTPIFSRIQRYFRNHRVETVSSSTPRTRQIAAELGVPLVETVRPSEKPVEVIVRLSEGGCPLMREVGDVFAIDSVGRLSSPLCGPSAAAVQRLVREQGLESGTTARCVCPVGPYELTFALDAA